MKALKCTLFLLFLSVLSARAQSDLLYTHFIYNKMAYNPGVTGSRGTPQFLALYRNQWMGLDGAPRTGTFNAQIPFADRRNALGVGLTSDKIGKVNNLDFDFTYAYHIPVGKANKLSLGINARIEQTKIDWDLANPLESGDDEIPSGQETAFTPNFGFGAYFFGEQYYIGVSAPRLLKNSLYLDRNFDSKTLDVTTFYVMGGWLFPVGASVEMAPSAMMTFNPSAPVDLDVNLNFIFMKSFWLGASYRLGDSVDGMIGYEFENGLRFGVAVDNTLSDLEKLTQGSWEVMLGYTFKCKDCDVVHLRFF
ncbi:MAG: type IX secretion system membrane protein PorP/SprF [Bacteroidetes bacterium]|nr:MAG: type IX secretion system membrane protein PorP/SprF [Bacteroidota bacterium]